jgi:putative heme-binding domain-containing protein
VEAGAKTFRSHCSPCHGLKGEGGSGPNLTTGHFYHATTDEELLNVISNGVPGTAMPGNFYSPDRLWQVVAYVRSLSAAAGQSANGDPKHGAELFNTKGCKGCHRINGVGGRLGPDLSDVGRSRSPEFLTRSIVDPSNEVQPRYWSVHCRDASGNTYDGYLMNEDTYTVQFIDTKERLHTFQKSGIKDYRVEKTSRMPAYKLSDGDTADLVAYLFSLRKSGGAE